MKKIFLSLLLTVLLSTTVSAKNIKSDFNSVIQNSKISKNSIALSIKEVNTGKTLYNLNENILMHPASVQKMLTLPAAIDILGEDYEFITGIYSRENDGYLIKLSADPYFTSSDLKTLVKEIDKQTVKKIYIDDSIIEKKDWGEGWQWDDDLNTSMPHFNAYNLDGNIIKITIMPDYDKEETIVINPSKYPITFFNNIKIGDISKIQITRENDISPNTLTLNGTVNKPVTIYIPIRNLKKYFDLKLTQATADRNIYLKQSYILDKQIQTDKSLNEIKHPISQAINDILKYSNNMMSETVMKIAGAKAYDETGTDINGIKVFETYCKKLGLDTSRIKLVDASGVSKNNLIYADFITEYLIKNKNNSLYENLPTAGEGTLAQRMIPLKDNLRAKTGTLSDISGISGFVTSKNGTKYVFSIMINDPNSTTSEKKTLEDYIIRELWQKG